MKVKFYSIALVIVMALSMLSVGAFAAEETCEHTWEAGGTVAATCEADGSQYYLCNLCGEIKTETTDRATGHTWESAPDQAATCEKAGKINQKVCAVCGEHVYDEVPALGHTWESAPDQAATCEKAGKINQKVCAVCGEHIYDEVPALGHTWDEGVEDGDVIIYTCSVCGETKTEAVETPAPFDPPAEDDKDEDKPVAPPVGGDSGKTESPKTGDHTVAFFFVGMVTILAAAVMVVFASKKSKSEK